jgi:hypothetical protein
MPAVISKSNNGVPASGLVKGTARDSGNIVIQTKAGGYPTKQTDGQQQFSTSLASDSTAGQPGNYLEGTNQNEEGSGYISVTALSYNSGTGVLTVTVANHFTVGQNLIFNGFLNGGIALDRVNATILTRTASQVTVNVGTGLTISTDTGFCQYTSQSQGSGLSLNAGRQ